jgi:hypothetical protein
MAEGFLEKAHTPLMPGSCLFVSHFHDCYMASKKSASLALLQPPFMKEKIQIYNRHDTTQHAAVE